VIILVTLAFAYRLGSLGILALSALQLGVAMRVGFAEKATAIIVNRFLCTHTDLL
jgi:hypothetical protein